MTEKTKIAEKIIERAEGLFPGRLDDAGIERIKLFAREQIEWGEKMHLVARGSFGESLERQVVDSLLMLYFAERTGALARKQEKDQEAIRVADIGSGYGFPGIIWKILSPGTEITFYERKEKAALFLERLAVLMSLEGTRTRGDAALDSGKAVYDLVISKAAGRLPAILPLAESLLGAGGKYLTIKGSEWEWELEGYSGKMTLDFSEPAEGERGSLLLFRREKD
ncbi:MAG: class I SAM-dependent methyltransferase [Candidatus Krumholzibacteriota bacterium]|nr:class I SAM-dependent methyltransferase [Candidatus Krumholzibacteriota bacterium]